MPANVRMTYGRIPGTLPSAARPSPRNRLPMDLLLRRSTSDDTPRIVGVRGPVSLSTAGDRAKRHRGEGSLPPDPLDRESLSLLLLLLPVLPAVPRAAAGRSDAPAPSFAVAAPGGRASGLDVVGSAIGAEPPSESATGTTVTGTETRRHRRAAALIPVLICCSAAFRYRPANPSD